MLLENVTSTAPGEKLDEKLASLTFTPEERDREYLRRVVYDDVLILVQTTLVPPPSSDESAWWDDLGKHYCTCTGLCTLANPSLQTIRTESLYLSPDEMAHSHEARTRSSPRVNPPFRPRLRHRKKNSITHSPCKHQSHQHSPRPQRTADRHRHPLRE